MKQLFLFKDMEETRNKKGYIVNEQGRECSICEKFNLWSFFDKDATKKNGYSSQCRECVKIIKKRRYTNPKRVELFNNTERKHKFGDVREDGMIFFGYKIQGSPKKNFEKWIRKETYDSYIAKTKKHLEDRKAEYLKIEKKHKRGYIRADGMKFWKYNQVYAATNFEKWVTEAEFERLQFNATKRNYMLYSLGEFGGKDEPSDKIIGLNDHDLSYYIESLFEEGMTWKNRGNWEGKWNPKKPKWHLDHIIPLDAANTLEETKHLWHYTNLRPMWGNENLSKSNKHCRKEFAAFLAERRAANE